MRSRNKKHLGLWDQKARPPPKADAPTMAPEYHIDYTDSQLPVPARHCSRSGEAGGSDKWLYVDPQYPEDYSPFFSSIYYLIDNSDAIL